MYAASLGSMLAAYALLKRSWNGGREREPGPGRPGFWAGYKRARRTLTAGLFKLAAYARGQLEDGDSRRIVASAASYSTDSGSSATHLCLLEVRLRRAPGTAWYNMNRPNFN